MDSKYPFVAIISLGIEYNRNFRWEHASPSFSAVLPVQMIS